jgi:hypothetical protein
VNTIRLPSGQIERTEATDFGHWFKAAPPFAGGVYKVGEKELFGWCKVEAGTVCDHGYRFDLGEAAMVGDGFTVVAVDRYYVTRPLTLWPIFLERLNLTVHGHSTPVEICLPDGRVIETSAWRDGGTVLGNWPDAKASAQPITSWSATRIERAGHPWAKRLDTPTEEPTAHRPTGAALRLSREEVDALAADVMREFYLPCDMTAAPFSKLPSVVQNGWRQAATIAARQGGSIARRAAATALNDALGKPITAPVAKDLEELIQKAGRLKLTLKDKNATIAALEERISKAVAIGEQATERTVIRADELGNPLVARVAGKPETQSGWTLFVPGATTEEDALARLGVIGRHKIGNLRAQIRDLNAELSTAKAARIEAEERSALSPDKLDQLIARSRALKDVGTILAGHFCEDFDLSRPEARQRLTDLFHAMRPLDLPDGWEEDPIHGHLGGPNGAKAIIYKDNQPGKFYTYSVRLRTPSYATETQAIAIARSCVRAMHQEVSEVKSDSVAYRALGEVGFALSQLLGREVHLDNAEGRGKALHNIATLTEDLRTMHSDLYAELTDLPREKARSRWREEGHDLLHKPPEQWGGPSVRKMVSAVLTTLTASRNNAAAAENRWVKACATDEAELKAAKDSLESANAEIVRLNGLLADANRDRDEIMSANSRRFAAVVAERTSLQKQLDDARRSLDEVHARYHPQLERADATINALREDLAAANRRPLSLRATLKRRLGMR